MKTKWKKIISLAAAAACGLSCTEGVLAADARSIAEWREYMTKPFSAGDWATVLEVASEDARDITQETVDVEISVDENDIHDLHYEILGIQTEMADGYNKYFDNGDIKKTYKDFSENDSEIYPMAKAGLCLKIRIPQGVKRLRLDPGEAMGGLLLRKLAFEDGRPVIFQTNGFDMGDGKYYFGAGDPQFIIDDIQGNTLDIEIEVLKEQEAREEFWRKFSQVSSQKDMEIRHLNEKIRQMENTRVWKLYRSIKKNK